MTVTLLDVRSLRAWHGHQAQLHHHSGQVGIAVDFHRFAVSGAAVVLAPAADHVEILQRETGRIDLLMAACARFISAVLG